jgi:hypothetical protein
MEKWRIMNNNRLLGLLLAIALVALGVLAYLYYERTRAIAKIDVPGVSGEITKKGVDIEIGKPKNWLLASVAQRNLDFIVIAEKTLAASLSSLGWVKMKKILLSALLRPTKEGVEAKVAEFPDIKVSAWSIHGALLRLRQAVWQRMRWTDVEANCAGEPISPVPQKPSSNDLAMPIEVEVKPEGSSQKLVNARGWTLFMV